MHFEVRERPKHPTVVKLLIIFLEELCGMSRSDTIIMFYLHCTNADIYRRPNQRFNFAAQVTS